MCTVTYIPKGKNQFILTSNRDEQPSRSAKLLFRERLKKDEVIFPKDAKAGGTWIAIAQSGKVVCLLNGAFNKHQHLPPYKKSRGLMVLELFNFNDSYEFAQTYGFQGMEPFTMIVHDQRGLAEIRWDEKDLHFLPLDFNQFYIWSSTTLYDDQVRSKRESWFQSWREKTPSLNQDEVLHFHCTAGDGDPYNDVIMNRNDIVRTVSITSIEKTDNDLFIFYHDLLSGHKLKDEIQHNKQISFK